MKKTTKKTNKVVNEYFCVIGPCAKNRTFLSSQNDAVAHAEKLISDNNPPTTGYKFSSATTKLFVVKIVEVVELAPPPMNKRKPNSKDFI